MGFLGMEAPVVGGQREGLIDAHPAREVLMSKFVKIATSPLTVLVIMVLGVLSACLFVYIRDIGMSTSESNNFAAVASLDYDNSLLDVGTLEENLEQPASLWDSTPFFAKAMILCAIGALVAVFIKFSHMGCKKSGCMTSKSDFQTIFDLYGDAMSLFDSRCGDILPQYLKDFPVQPTSELEDGTLVDPFVRNLSRFSQGRHDRLIVEPEDDPTIPKEISLDNIPSFTGQELSDVRKMLEKMCWLVIYLKIAHCNSKLCEIYISEEYKDDKDVLERDYREYRKYVYKGVETWECRGSSDLTVIWCSGLDANGSLIPTDQQVTFCFPKNCDKVAYKMFKSILNLKHRPMTIQNIDHRNNVPFVFFYHPDLLLQSVIVGSSRVDLQACKLEYSIVSPK